MKKSLFAVALFVCVVLLLGAAPEAEALQNDWGLNENDWTVVDGGTAGGMTSCTATRYCVSCETSTTGQDVCTRAYRNAYCLCEYFYQGTTKKCKGSGTCTYSR